MKFARPLLGAPLLVLAACAEAPQDALPLNFVFVLADDLGWRDVGYNGAAYSTPHIDRLAADGIVFGQSYAAAPSCSPTRASLLTGQHPARLGLTRAIRLAEYWSDEEISKPRPNSKYLQAKTLDHLPADTPTIADRLSEAGYRTCFVGKWHLGDGDSVPARMGFSDTRALGLYPASNYFPPFHVFGAEDVAPGTYLTDHLTDLALDFLREARSEPFLLYLSHFAVHGPWDAKPELVERYRSTLDPEGAQHNPTYAAMVHSLDESVGRVVAELDALGLRERTVVVFTSDNGGTLSKTKAGEETLQLTSNAPLRGGKLEIYEGGLRVPTVLRVPGVAAGTWVDEPILSTDFYPTLLALAGLERRSAEAPDGLDLHPTWGGAPSSPALQRSALFFHVPHRQPAAAVRRGPFKLVHHFNGRSELYDLERDLGETNDLAASEPERTEALRAELFAWLASVGAHMPVTNPDYRARDEGAVHDDG